MDTPPRRIGARLLRLHRRAQPLRPPIFDERVHARLGSPPSGDLAASSLAGRPGRTHGVLPERVRRRDVFRMRRWLSLRGHRPIGARLDLVPRPLFGSPGGLGMSRVFVSGAFDDVRSPKLRFLQEAAKFGELTLLLWPDEAISSIRGSVPKMSLAERLYYFEALRYVDRVEVAPRTLDPDRLRAELGSERLVWAVAAEGDASRADPESANAAKRSWCISRGVELREIPTAALAGFPYRAPPRRWSAIRRSKTSGRDRLLRLAAYRSPALFRGSLGLWRAERRHRQRRERPPTQRRGTSPFLGIRAKLRRRGIQERSRAVWCHRARDGSTPSRR